jgi:sigma-E factor negative regulatory protein RseA
MTNDDVLKSQEVKREVVCALVSSLVDGQLRGHDFAKAVESIHSDANSRAAWQSYHVIGDVLRSPELAEHARDTDFLARFQSRLAADADAQLAHKPRSPNSAPSDLPARPARPASRASANESVFAWKLTAGFASLAAVVAIGWSMASGLTGSSGGAQLAQAAPPAQTSSTGSGVSESAVMIRDPNLDALLAAHKQFGGGTALQMPSGFLRNATFEGAAR